jgi:aspartate racemase
MKKSSIGLIGGMGPYASAYFYKLLLTKSRDIYGAENNNDFPEIIIDSIPVPDFISDTAHLSEAKTMLQDRVRKLNKYGVTRIAMICNTGHILYDDLASVSSVPFDSLIESVSQEVKKKNIKRVGLLGTSTTVKSSIYKKNLRKLGVQVVNPSIEMQKKHEEIIRELIAGKTHTKQKQKFVRTVNKFVRDNKLDGIILGCTEIPMMFPKVKFPNIAIIDCLDVLADKLLAEYYKN